MINFESDYTEGCIEEILLALKDTNHEQTSGYGTDPHCENARNLIRKEFDCKDADVHFVVGGTQANLIVISSILRPYQAVICAESGHINVHETGAIEATGHKCVTIATKDGTLTAQQVEDMYLNHINDETFEHTVQPGMVYISLPTENGTLYTKQQLTDLYTTCKKYGLYLFIDGARLGYGLTSYENDIQVQDLKNLCDVFYIGGTKIGALFGEAIVILNPALTKDFRYNIKQRGALLAKGRLLGIQFEQLFTNHKYFEISKHAIACAYEIQKALQDKGYTFLYKPQTNQLFPILENKKMEELRTQFSFHTAGKIDETHTAVRFVTSFMTTMDNVNALIKAL